MNTLRDFACKNELKVVSSCPDVAHLSGVGLVHQLATSGEGTPEDPLCVQGTYYHSQHLLHDELKLAAKNKFGFPLQAHYTHVDGRPWEACIYTYAQWRPDSSSLSLYCGFGDASELQRQISPEKIDRVQRAIIAAVAVTAIKAHGLEPTNTNLKGTLDYVTPEGHTTLTPSGRGDHPMASLYSTGPISLPIPV